jgi:WD40 repeat protein
MSVILATAGYDHTIRFWEAPSGLCSRTLRHPDSQVCCLEITPDKQFIAAGGNPQIRLYEINNPTTDTPVLTLEGHTSSITSLGFQRDGRYLYSGSEDGTFCVFTEFSEVSHALPWKVIHSCNKNLALNQFQQIHRNRQVVGLKITNVLT